MAKKIYEKEGLKYANYEKIKSAGGAGYAALYIHLNWNKSTLVNEAKLEVYKTLFEIDSRLGSKSELQLWSCCFFSVNLDIIEVININLLYLFILFLVFRKY